MFGKEGNMLIIFTANVIASEFLLKGGIHFQIRPQPKGCSYWPEERSSRTLPTALQRQAWGPGRD